VAATRISGICFGVICSVTLSVLIFPKSANCEAVDSMAHALLDLSAFHALAWTGGRSEALPGRWHDCRAVRCIQCMHGPGSCKGAFAHTFERCVCDTMESPRSC
jgi:hypothetical protein